MTEDTRFFWKWFSTLAVGGALLVGSLVWVSAVKERDIINRCMGLTLNVRDVVWGNFRLSDCPTKRVR
jgi:hypothetical protein